MIYLAGHQSCKLGKMYRLTASNIEKNPDRSKTSILKHNIKFSKKYLLEDGTGQEFDLCG